MNTAVPLLMFGLAGFAFGGTYALYTQRKPWWLCGLVALFGVLCLAAGWLYL